MEKVTADKIRKSKSKILMLTAYDFQFAKILDECGIDIVLVGDSLGNVVLGYDSTRPVTMADMVHHTKAVVKGVKRALIVADIPYGALSLSNAKKLIKIGAGGVKVEGIKDIKVIKEIIKAGIPVMGHLGHLPQTMRKPKIHQDRKLIDQARKLEQAGVFAIVLEMVDKDLAGEITQSVKIPSIGIGSGPGCRGQVLVTYDLIGLSDWSPKFVKRFTNSRQEIKNAVKMWIGDRRL